jgi:hypothetical protein
MVRGRYLVFCVLCMDIQFSQNYLGQDFHFANVLSCYLCQNQFTVNTWIPFWVLYAILWVYMSLFIQKHKYSKCLDWICNAKRLNCYTTARYIRVCYNPEPQKIYYFFQNSVNIQWNESVSLIRKHSTKGNEVFNRSERQESLQFKFPHYNWVKIVHTVNVVTKYTDVYKTEWRPNFNSWGIRSL